MKINQGVCVIISAIAILLMSAFSEPLRSIEFTGWFLLGAGLMKLNDYWGD